MKRLLIILLLLMPLICWGQFLGHDFLWEVNSSYQYDPDTCAFISDTTAADSAVFYIGTGPNFTGILPSFQIRFDSTGVGTLVYADSVTCKLYPRLPTDKDSEKEADGRGLKTLWNDPITLSLNNGTLCSNWSPTAETVYFLGNSDSWNGRPYFGLTLTVAVGATDACYITRLGVIRSFNR